MNKELKRKKLIYRSVHRGCKEMDILFGEFALAVVPTLSDAELDQFEQFIDISDAVFYNWIIEKEPIPKEYNNAVYKKIKIFNAQRCQK